MSDTTLIVELDGRGHRLYYVRIIADEALRQGKAVTILLGESDHIDDFAGVHLAALPDSVKVLKTSVRNWAEIERQAQVTGADVTVVPDSDPLLLGLLRRGGWRGPGLVSLLVMRPRVPAVGSRGRRIVANLVKALLITAFTFSPRIRIRVLRSALSTRRSIWKPAPDPVGMNTTPDAITQLRADWGIGTDHYWFGVLGAVTANKNVDLAAAAIAAANDRIAAPALLIAGRVEADLLPKLSAAADDLRAGGIPVVVVNRILTDGELDAAISAIDCLVLAYEHLGSSGTFGKALAAGTRVVAAGSPTLRDDCAAAGPGTSWQPLTTEALADGFAKASKQARPAPLDLASEPDFGARMLRAVD